MLSKQLAGKSNSVSWRSSISRSSEVSAAAGWEAVDAVMPVSWTEVSQLLSGLVLFVAPASAASAATGVAAGGLRLDSWAVSQLSLLRLPVATFYSCFIACWPHQHCLFPSLVLGLKEWAPGSLEISLWTLEVKIRCELDPWKQNPKSFSVTLWKVSLENVTTAEQIPLYKSGCVHRRTKFDRLFKKEFEEKS